MSKDERSLLQRIRGNAEWDTVKWLWAGGKSAVIPAAYGLLQRLRHVHVDWIGLGILFGLCMIFLLLVAGRNHERPKDFDIQSGVVTPLIRRDISSEILSPLQVRCLKLSRDLEQFLNEMPPPINPIAAVAVGLAQFATVAAMQEREAQYPQEMEDWSKRLGHAYADRFSLRITALIHKLGAEDIAAAALEPYQRVSSDDDVRAAIHVLRQLVLEVEDKNETRISRGAKSSGSIR